MSYRKIAFCLLMVLAFLFCTGMLRFSSVVAQPERSQRVAANTPSPQYVTTAVVKEVKDGDTVEVELRTVVTVRFLDCWCPESRRDPRIPAAKQEAEKQRGIRAKANLAGMLPTGTEVVVQVPLPENGDLSDVMTMGRVLGYVWPKNGTKSYSQIQVESGHATVTKPEYLK